MIKKITVITLAVAVALCIPVGATSYSGTGYFRVQYSSYAETAEDYYGVSSTQLTSTIPNSAALSTSISTNPVYVKDLYALIPRTTNDIAKLYCSFYFSSTSGGIVANWDNAEIYAQYNSSLYGTVKDYTVESEFAGNSGVLSYSFNGSEAETLTSLQLWCSSEDLIYCNTGDLTVTLRSMRLIYTETTAELQQLEDVADQVSQIYNIQIEYYPEVISKVDSIYQELGTTNGLLEESIQQFEDWNTVTEVPGTVTEKTEQADQVLEDIESLEKPEPSEIVPAIDADTSTMGDVLVPIFQSAYIMPLIMMSLSFAFVSYVLYGKRD